MIVSEKQKSQNGTGCVSRAPTWRLSQPISDALVGTKQISLEQLRKVLGLESFSGAVKAHQAPPTETEFDGRRSDEASSPQG